LPEEEHDSEERDLEVHDSEKRDSEEHDSEEDNSAVHDSEEGEAPDDNCYISYVGLQISHTLIVVYEVVVENLCEEHLRRDEDLR
jgi:hypothetical protein